jgi:MFS family permease
VSTPEPTSANYGSSSATPASTEKKTLGIVSLVLSIVGLGLVFLSPLFGGIAAIVGIVLGFLSRGREPGARKLALAGIVVGFVAIAVGLVVFVLTTIAVMSAINSGTVTG